jgi:phosphoglucosamine mutase
MTAETSRELFGTDGVRGLAGHYPLDTDGATRIGAAVGSLFGQPGQTVIIGADTRQSSVKLVKDLTAGLTSSGVNVVTVGVITTPGLAYLTREGDYAAGVMVTASHNPYTYNGVKVFDAHGDKLDDDIEARLNALIVDGVEPNNPGSRKTELVNLYQNFLVGSVDRLELAGLKIAIDTANGSASGIAERVFRLLGAEVTPLFNTPNGTNINDGCGATDTTVLQKTVVDNGLALGIAFDGDADRIMMVDHQGRQVNGDQLLYMMAVSDQVEGVVATVMSNLGFEQALQHNGIKLERVQVGDRYVLEGLRATGYELGGEQSGHIIFPELLATGDGLLAAVQALRVLHGANHSLADWRDDVPMLPQALVNISVSDKKRLESPEVLALVAAETALLGKAGRLLIRPSGTEPLARVMVEAPDAQAIAERIATALKELV